MNIILYKKCCGHGVRELNHLLRELDKNKIIYNLHITNKSGLVGQKVLHHLQRGDDKVYIKQDDNDIVEFWEYLKNNGYE